MKENNIANPLELGRYLMQVRERAGIKQAELARMITWSQAVLSRVEAGDRGLAPDELQMVVAAIGTPEAQKLQELIQRDWTIIPRPPLSHPDQDVLWNAEQVAKELTTLSEQPDVRNAFERRLSAYIKEIQQTAALLLKRDHQIAFIGSIGIGKSTAICRLTSLEVPGQDGTPPIPVLEAGAGGITICEVHLLTGPGYGLRIEPRSDEEIRADVTDFAEYLLNIGTDATTNQHGSENDAQGISKEIERAIRNMSGLKIRREKVAGGKVSRRDEAKELAQQQSSMRELVVEILARMELHKRDRRDVWYDSSAGKLPLNWLKDAFEEVNNGRHPNFTLPKRIEVIVPSPLLDMPDLTVRIIDTKGIDRTAARPDLETHLDDPHTLTVLCSGFNNAPAAETRLLLERAIETGVRSLNTNSTLLVLPRPNEALAVKDESGIRAETVEEGYELKGEQVEMSLQPLGLNDYAVGFFNAHQDDSSQTRAFLSSRITQMREVFHAKLHEITTNAHTLIRNHEQEQVQEVIRHAASMLRSWANQNTTPPALGAHVQDSLMEQLAKAYASTIRAAVRREGEWSNLSYFHHLGFGARRLAALSLHKPVEGFSALCKTMIGNPEYLEAQDLINQSERILLAAYDDLLRKVQIMGQTSFRDALKLDAELWTNCEDEWGQGPGYRDRVTAHNVKWFEADSQRELEKELQALIQRGWKMALNKLTTLFDPEE
ncbi:MAG: helix-turn-helix transcriptional regulator [Candidatus Thiodiazotropha sp. 6PDIVS]